MKLSIVCLVALLGAAYSTEELSAVKSSLRGVNPEPAAAGNVPAAVVEESKTTAKVSLDGECNTLEVPANFAVNADRGKIFNMLSTNEINDVLGWMYDNSGLNITPYDDADLYADNYVTYVYLAEPDKTAALNYLKTGLNKPGRFAHVHVSLAGLATPCMRQYTVGPLPISGDTALSAPIALGGITDVPFDARQTSAKEYDHLDELVLDVMGQIDDEMRDSYGTNYYAECPDDFCLTYSDTSPRGPQRDITIWFLFDVEAFFANPIGFYLTFRMGTLDTASHVLKLIVYNGQSYDTVADFKTAYTGTSIKKLGNRPLANVLKANSNGVDWASLVKAPNPTGIHTGRGARTRPNSNIIGPQVQEPGGKRFLVQDNYVDYLGWTFNVGHTPISGLKIYNVMYRGKRVAYEIGLSEALAVYSGVVDLVQAATVYGDTAWGLGASANEMARGIDCPSTGILSDVTFLMDSQEPTTGRNTICIFEQAGQTPLRRHSNGDSYGGLAAHSLVVRILLPVYNYDYVLDHIFHINGALELRGSTSGYLQSTFWSPQLDAETKSFGRRIGPFTAGTTHDHVLNFKIDMDVNGVTNQLVQTTTKAVRATPKDLNGKRYALSNFDVATDYMTKRSSHITMQREAGWSMTGGGDPVTYSIVAKRGSMNKWDCRQGYRLKLNGAINNVVSHTKSLRAYAFSKYTLAATIRHEDEPTVSSIYDQSDTTGTIMSSVTPDGAARPLVHLDRFISNKEMIDNRDLVLWVNVGVQHHTHSEDIPVTTTNGNTVNIWLLPTNLFDYDDTMDLGNSVYAPAGESMDLFDLKQDESEMCPIAYGVLGEGYIGGGDGVEKR